MKVDNESPARELRPWVLPAPRKSRLPRINGPLIFEANWAGSIFQKATTLSVGAAFWAVWLALLAPLATTSIWLLAPSWGMGQFLRNVEDNLLTIALIAVTGIFLGAMLAAWGLWQWIMKMTRPAQSTPKTVEAEELCRFHGIAMKSLEDSWTHQRLVIHHDETGQITMIEATKPFLSDNCPQRAKAESSSCDL